MATKRLFFYFFRVVFSGCNWKSDWFSVRDSLTILPGLPTSSRAPLTWDRPFTASVMGEKDPSLFSVFSRPKELPSAADCERRGIGGAFLLFSKLLKSF